MSSSVSRSRASKGNRSRDRSDSYDDEDSYGSQDDYSRSHAKGRSNADSQSRSRPSDYDSRYASNVNSSSKKFMSRGRSGPSGDDSDDDRSGDVDASDEDVCDETSYARPSESAYTASRLGDQSRGGRTPYRDSSSNADSRSQAVSQSYAS